MQMKTENNYIATTCLVPIYILCGEHSGPSNNSNWRPERAHLVVQLAIFICIRRCILAPRLLRAKVTGLASSARHQCVAFKLVRRCTLLYKRRRISIHQLCVWYHSEGFVSPCYSCSTDVYIFVVVCSKRCTP